MRRLLAILLYQTLAGLVIAQQEDVTGLQDGLVCILNEFDSVSNQYIDQGGHLLPGSPECEKFPFQQIVNLLANHPVWNVSTAIHFAQVEIFCSAVENNLEECYNSSIWQELGALTVQYLLTLENCATSNSVSLQNMEDYVWQELTEPIYEEFSESSTKAISLALLRCAASIRPGGPFGPIFGKIPFPESIINSSTLAAESLKEAASYTDRLCQKNQNDKYCFSLYTSPLYLWHVQGTPISCAMAGSWGSCYGEMYQVFFEEWDGRIYAGLKTEENYIPGPAHLLPDELAFENSFQNQGWPCCNDHRGDGCDSESTNSEDALLITFAVVGGLLFIPLCILCSKRRKLRRDRLATGAIKK